MKTTASLSFWTALLIGAVTAGALAEAPGDTLLWKALFDAGHALFGGLLALLGLRVILAWHRRPAPTSGDQWLALAAAVGIGFAFEIVQFFLPRDADPVDLLRDALGAAAFLLLAWAQRRAAGGARPRPGRRILAGAAAVALLGGAFVSVATLAHKVLQRDAAFPILVQPGASWMQPFLFLRDTEWQVRARPSPWLTAPESPRAPSVARVTFHRGRFPGFAMRETTPDWRRFETLVLEVFSDLPAPVDIVLRVDDAAHDQTDRDRFHDVLHVEPGPQVFRIPLDAIRTAPAGRPMDMAHVRRLVVFAIEVDDPFVLSFGPIRLE